MATTTLSEFAVRLREFMASHKSENAGVISSAEEDGFNRLALSLFSLQFSHNQPYRKFCQSRKIDPRNVKRWSAIPAMPTAGFKESELTSLPSHHRTAVFHSSGTTGQRPSRHFHNADSLSVYEASLASWFQTNLLPEKNESEERRWLFLTPSPSQAPHSSLVHMFDCLRQKFGHESALFTGFAQDDGSWDINLNATIAALNKATSENRPVMLFGTAFNFIHLLDHLGESGLMLRLPAGSRVLETGGYKGRSRSLPKDELHSLITNFLSVPENGIVSEYGMSELSSQAYDKITGTSDARIFHFPPWARAQIISAENGLEVAEDDTGLIRIFDLANVYSVMAIQTEDLGIKRRNGFELLGRAALAESRGCSLMSR